MDLEIYGHTDGPCGTQRYQHRHMALCERAHHRNVGGFYGSSDKESATVSLGFLEAVIGAIGTARTEINHRGLSKTG